MLDGSLYPQLGGIPEIREIDVYLRNMTFKRKLFGWDPGEVQDCFAEVMRRYRAIVASLIPQQEQAWQIQEFQARLAQVLQENAALQEWGHWYEQANAALGAENEQLWREAGALQAELARRGGC
jgi:hypothetical protein